MSSGFAKVYSSMLSSSVWSHSSDVRIVWITMLAMSDASGFVAVSVPGLAHQARVPESAVHEAIVIFTSPDPVSRTAAEEGRRVRVVEGGFEIINHSRYRRGDPHSSAARRQARYRSESVTSRNLDKPDVTSRNLDKPRITSFNVASASASEIKKETVATDHDQRVPCPPDLDLFPAQKANLTMAGIPDWAITIMVSEVKTTVLGKSMSMTADSWRAYVAKAIMGRWSDPQKRPKKPCETPGRVLSWGPNV